MTTKKMNQKLIYTLTCLLLICLLVAIGINVLNSPTKAFAEVEENKEVTQSNREINALSTTAEPFAFLGHNHLAYPICEHDSGYKISSAPVTLTKGPKDGIWVNHQVNSELWIKWTNALGNTNGQYGIPRKCEYYREAMGKEYYFQYEDYRNRMNYNDMQSNLTFEFTRDNPKPYNVSFSNDTNKGVSGISEFNGVQIGYGRYAYRMTTLDSNGNEQVGPYVISEEMYKNRNVVSFNIDKFQGDLDITNVYEVYVKKGLKKYWYDIRADFKIEIRVDNSNLQIMDSSTGGEIGREPNQVYYTSNGFKTSLAGDKYGKVKVRKNGSQISEINFLNERNISFKDDGIYELEYINGYGNTNKFTVVVDKGDPQITLGGALLTSCPKITVGGKQYYYSHNSGVVNWTSIMDSISSVKVDGQAVSTGQTISNGSHTITVNKINKEYTYNVYIGPNTPTANYKMLTSSTYANRQNRYSTDVWITRLSSGIYSSSTLKDAQELAMLDEYGNKVTYDDRTKVYTYEGKEYTDEDSLMEVIAANSMYKVSRVDLTTNEIIQYNGGQTSQLYLNNYMFVRGGSDIDTTEIRYVKISIDDYIYKRYNLANITSALQTKNSSTGVFTIGKTMENQAISDKNGVYFIMEYNKFGDVSNVYSAIYIGSNETQAVLHFNTDTEKGLEIDLNKNTTIPTGITSFYITDSYNLYDEHAEIQVYRVGKENEKNIYLMGEESRVFIGDGGVYVIVLIDRNGNKEEFIFEVREQGVECIGVDENGKAYGDVTVVMKEEYEITMTNINAEEVELIWTRNGDGTKSVTINRDTIDQDVVIGYIGEGGEEEYIGFTICC